MSSAIIHDTLQSNWPAGKLNIPFNFSLFDTWYLEMSQEVITERAVDQESAE